MAYCLRSMMKLMGCSEKFIDKLFPSHFDKLIKAIIKGDL